MVKINLKTLNTLIVNYITFIFFILVFQCVQIIENLLIVYNHLYTYI